LRALGAGCEEMKKKRSFKKMASEEVYWHGGLREENRISAAFPPRWSAEVRSERHLDRACSRCCTSFFQFEEECFITHLTRTDNQL
jgi:hypothetical protein